MADLPTILLVSAIPLFIVFWVALALDNRRKGIKTSLRHLLIPLILIGVVFGAGYVVTQIGLQIGAENLLTLQDDLLVFQGILSTLFLGAGIFAMLRRKR